jgi:hypothetical protein
MTFEDRLAALRAGIASHADPGTTLHRALGAVPPQHPGDRKYATDTAMIRDLFLSLNGDRCRFLLNDCGYMAGTNELGAEVVRRLLQRMDDGFRGTRDLNGNHLPAMWLYALVDFLRDEAAETAAREEDGHGDTVEVWDRRI